MESFLNADEAIRVLAEQMTRIIEDMPAEDRVCFFERLLRHYPGSRRAAIELGLSLTGQMPERPAVKD